MRRVAVAVVALVLAASGSAATSSVTALKVTYWPNGANESVRKTSILRCDPVSGTVAQPRVACRKLAAGGQELFAPVPRRAICTEIYGGPDLARITGVVAGQRVWATFNLTNGCHIGRWNRFSPWLLPRT